MSIAAQLPIPQLPEPEPCCEGGVPTSQIVWFVNRQTSGFACSKCRWWVEEIDVSNYSQLRYNYIHRSPVFPVVVE